jgi:hypothetical protein
LRVSEDRARRRIFRSKRGEVIDGQIKFLDEVKIKLSLYRPWRPLGL